jgi:hypothetical protein
MCENRGQAEYGKPSTTKSSFAGRNPVATCAVSLARLKQNSTNWVNCAPAQIVYCAASPTIGADWMLAGLRGIGD